MALTVALINGPVDVRAVTEVKLTASDAAEGNLFGTSVAVSGEVAIVGARWDDDAGLGSGSAYVFQRDEGGADNWGEVAKLIASDAAADDRLGTSAAVSGGVAIVGASHHNGVNTDTGSAYVFQRDEGGADNWGEVAKLTASDTAFGDLFGGAVSINGDTAIVGADRKGNDTGSAYVFQRDEGGADNWGEVVKLIASDAALGDFFGDSVAVSGELAIVGAPGGDSAYIFQRDEGGADNWGEVVKLIASDAAEGDAFGTSVALNGEVAIVGASNNDDAGNASGSAYVFQRDEGGADNWGEVAKLMASDAAVDDKFGTSVAVSSELAIVGSPFAEDNSGTAYVFQRDEGGADNWGEVEKLTASDAALGDFFGDSVAVSGEVAIVGASYNDDAGNASGSAYIYLEPGVCSETLGIDQCKLKPRFRKVVTKPDKLVLSCKVLDTTVAVGGIDPSLEQLLFKLDDSGGACFTATTDPADCVEKNGSYKCKPPRGTVPFVKLKIKPDRRNPGSYKFKYKAKDADLQCLQVAETPWTMEVEIGDDCGQVACLSSGNRFECPGP